MNFNNAVDSKSAFYLLDKYKHNKIVAQDVRPSTRDIFSSPSALSLVSAAQLQAFCREFNYDLSRKELELIMSRLDRNEDQRVTVEEFLFEMRVQEEETQ